MRHARLAAITLPALFTALTASLAGAQAVEQQGCNEDYVAAQRTRKEGKLLAAREHLLACSRELCMDIIERDCATWLGEVDQSTPTVVVFARDRWGDETLEVRVLIDGAIARDVLDAKAIAVDPGPHTFRFETVDGTPVEQKVILREGEKNRRLDVRFGVGGAGDSERVPGDDDGLIRFEWSDLGWVLGGAGVGALAGATLFFASASAAESDLDDAACAPACPKASRDAIDRQRTNARVLFGLGAASVIGGIALVMFANDGESGTAFRAPLDVAIAPEGALARWRGEF